MLKNILKKVQKMWNESSPSRHLYMNNKQFHYEKNKKN